MELTGLEAAGGAAIACDAASMTVDQLLDEFDVAALIGGRHQHRSLEQLVETEQRRVTAQLLAHELVCSLRTLALEFPVEQFVQQIQRGNWCPCSTLPRRP